MFYRLPDESLSKYQDASILDLFVTLLFTVILKKKLNSSYKFYFQIRLILYEQYEVEPGLHYY